MGKKSFSLGPSPLGADVKGNGELYKVDLISGQWQQVASDLPGINFLMEV